MSQLSLPLSFFFLWLPNSVNAASIEALASTDDDPAERPSHDTEDDYEDPRHSNSDLIVAYHTRRKVLVRDQKVLTGKLKQMKVYDYVPESHWADSKP